MVLRSFGSSFPSSSPAMTVPYFTNGSHLEQSLVVQKFGGTSVGTAERMLNVANIVKSTLEKSRVVVVLSAMSSLKKSEGTTSRLLEAADEALIPESVRFNDIVDLIESTHLKSVEESIVGDSEAMEALREEVRADIAAECRRLKSFLEAASVIGEISPRTKDIVISTGEKLAARLFAGVLKSHGVKAVYVNLEKLINRYFDEKAIDQKFYDYLAMRLSEVLHSAASAYDVVPVVTGYLGPVPGSILTTIGRGYTDLTAALIAVGLRASELQIWKEVDGIFTADPRKAPLARLLPSISPAEAAELTYYGSEVIHPFTMEQVIRAKIPIRIKNTFSPEGEGTIILPEEQDDGADADELPMSPSGRIRMPPPRHPTAVTIKDHVTVVNVHSNRKSVSHGFFAQIFMTLDRNGIVVDLISTSEVHISMALSPNVREYKLEQALTELRKYGEVDVIPDLCIVSLVGRQMRNMVGASAKMFSTLAKNKVNIEMISQGASEINISCVVSMEHAQVALKAIHDDCILASMLLAEEEEHARLGKIIPALSVVDSACALASEEGSEQ
ncbi:Aspartate/glutamate/uridylate kinase [Polychytrium aggregatum]|uniref:Aspartate/glutamate/uridylate kinase n=1 Tax=Polychytrium aggregatum TaxID=110093 RepID=UPI0022FEC6F6|nr:Aspartate/glutamate/uridylate kinase [Polychytrium aggregatum]KAI9202729.1 Aspartate/glutamate/uridylate kinase [Polychytrium aggregatum]